MKFIVIFLASLFLVNAFQSHNLGDAKKAIELVYEGMFQEAGNTRPDVVNHCYDDDNAQLMINFLNTVFKQMVANNVVAVKKTVALFKEKVDPELRSCLLKEEEMKKVNAVIFGWAEASLDYIVDRTIAYAMSHQPVFHEKAIDCNNNFQAGNFKEFGIKASAAAKIIFKPYPPSLSLTDREALQMMFNGGFEVVNLSHPVTLVSCFDDESAKLSVKTVGTVLDSLVTYDVLTAEQTIFDYNSQLPQEVKDCLNKNEEYQAFLKAYHIADLTPKQRTAKIMKYLRLHIFKLHSTVVDADTKFKNGAFTDVGHIFGVVLKDIFNSKKLEGLTDSQIVQELYNGIFEKVDLPHPKTVVSCFDDPSATLTVKYLGVILQQLASSNLVAAERSAHEYTSQLPAAVLACLDKNEEIQAARVKYNLVNMTFEQIQAKVKKYSLTHIFQLYIDAVKANNNFLNGNYNQVGQQGGALAQAIFKSPSSNQLSSDRDSLQQMFNGVFETGKLAHPTTVVPCFDDASASLTVEAVGNILHQAAKNNFAAAQQIATAFVAKLPQPVKDCLSTNQELVQLEHAYHLDTLTPTQIQQKITTYVTTHLIQVHKDFVEADNNFQGGKFFQVGQKAGEVCQNIFGKVAFTRVFLG